MAPVVSRADNVITSSPGDHVPHVTVIGAGPAGLMLGALLARFGLDVDIMDDRPDQTSAGRADGLQPKSVETLRMLRLADPLLQKGARIYDICFWKATAAQPLRRIGREVHYPPEIVDLLDDFILLVHQGMVEEVFVDDLRKRGVEVRRNHRFEKFSGPDGDGLLKLEYYVVGDGHELRSASGRYIVGCDGARSKVRACIPNTQSVGKSHESVWGVLDGELATDFPDLWSKSVIYSEAHGSILVIPRERNMTRLYIEIKAGTETSQLCDLGSTFVMQRARQILAPYTLEWTSVEWFGHYQVGQRVAARFSDPSLRAFIAGDAGHTHSPKAAQGMNTSIHDAWNLAWKLNLAVRGLARPALLASYEVERGKIAHDLIDFDYEHANQMAAGDADSLAANFRTNVGFISGVGVKYDSGSVLNPSPTSGPLASRHAFRGEPREGGLLPPAKARRYIDANPVDVQLDIPVLGQFRTYVFVADVLASRPFLEAFGADVGGRDSFIGRVSRAAAASYAQTPRRAAPDDVYLQTQRYTPVSEIMTFALITTMNKADVEVSDLPPLFAQSVWTFYLDDVAHLDTRKRRCTTKWVGELAPGEAVIMNVRPDGYVGSIGRFDASREGEGSMAAKWLGEYYEGFLQEG